MSTRTALPPAPLPVSSSSAPGSPGLMVGSDETLPLLDSPSPPPTDTVPTSSSAFEAPLHPSPPLKSSPSPSASDDPASQPLPPQEQQKPHYHHRTAGTSQMTLAISRSDATRMLEASRKFNMELSRMQEEEWNEIEAAEERDGDGSYDDKVGMIDGVKLEGLDDYWEGACNIDSDDDDGDGDHDDDGDGDQDDDDDDEGDEDHDNDDDDGVDEHDEDKHTPHVDGSSVTPDVSGGDASKTTGEASVSLSPSKTDAEKSRDDEGNGRCRSPTEYELSDKHAVAISAGVGEGEAARDSGSSTPPDSVSEPPKRASTNALRREGFARKRHRHRRGGRDRGRRRRRPERCGGRKKWRSQRQRPTPLHLLLVPAAERCGDVSIASYLRRMRAEARTEREIEACLLLFLDMDKSTKLVTSFEVMGGKRKRRRNEEWSALAATGGEVYDGEFCPHGRGDDGGGREHEGDDDGVGGGDVHVGGVDIGDVAGAKTGMPELGDAMDMNEDVSGDGSDALAAGKQDGTSQLSITPVSPDDADVLPTVSASVDECDEAAVKDSDDPGVDCTVKQESDGEEHDEHDENEDTINHVDNGDYDEDEEEEEEEEEDDENDDGHCDLEDEDEEEEEEVDNESTAPPFITLADMRALFRCFLTSISTCIHHSDQQKSDSKNDNVEDEVEDDESNPRKARKSHDAHSPRSVASSEGMREWVLSSQTKREIEGIASFAADCLAEFVQKREASSNGWGGGARDGMAGKDPQIDGVHCEMSEDKVAANPLSDCARLDSSSNAVVANQVITFEAFGDWYNSGGFSLVPWLELLDLSKWDFASRAAAAAAAATVSSERFRKRRTNGSHFDDGLDSIPEDEEDGLLPDLPSLPRSLKRLAGDEPDPNFRCAGGIARNLFSPSDVPPPSRSGASGEASCESKSRTVVSFDFTGAMPPGSNGAHRPFHICITEENLRMLKGLVNRTGLSEKKPDIVAEVMLRHASSSRADRGAEISNANDCEAFGDEQSCLMLHRDDFGRFVREIVPPEKSQAFDRAELENYSNYLTNFFTCFNCTSNSFRSKDREYCSWGPDHANAKELAVGFSFLCAGNKSTKLATAFELLDDGGSGHLNRHRLAQYLRSYLTMLVGISLLSETTTKTAETRRALLGFCADVGSGRRNRDPKTADMFTAVENGARWTQQQFLCAFEQKIKSRGGSSASIKVDMISFEDFAEWYTEGGYTVAPWLELLDLSKFLSLIGDQGDGERDRPFDDGRCTEIASSSVYGRNNLSTPRLRTPSNGNRYHSQMGGSVARPPAEVLFTFPLANRQSLVVLREDATYVKSVVQQLGLLAMAPEGAWDALFSYVRTRPVTQLAGNHGTRPPRGSSAGKGMDVEQATFVRAMHALLPDVKVLPNPQDGPGEVASTPTETLQNFFQSFDLDQIGLVAANELMGGLALLCGGKKSAKLAFAFSLFDGREDNKNDKKKKKSLSQPSNINSLDGTELFLFLRSLLIVLFSCCRQSLHLSADAVSRYIYDTAHTVAEDVMQYRRRRHRKGVGNGDAGRVDFDEFGEWYNEGGFETAPWLELLDLNKWVLLEDPNRASVQQTNTTGATKAPGVTPKKTAAVIEILSHGKNEMAEIPPKMERGENATVGGNNALCPPPHPYDAIDPNTDAFFGEDIDMGGIDDMDFNILGETGALIGGREKEKDGNIMAARSLPPTPGPMTPGFVSTTPGIDITAPSPSPRRNSQVQSRLPPAAAPSRTPPSSPDPRPQPAPAPLPIPMPVPVPDPKDGSISRNIRNAEMALPQPSVPPPPQPSTSLKFHLLTAENHGGFVISISQERIQQLRRMVIDSGLYKIDISAACAQIIDRAVSRKKSNGGGGNPNQPTPPCLVLTKDRFDSAMRRVVSLSKSRMTTETQHSLSELLTSIFRAFESSSECGDVNALELASGFTILCGGRKSDKLEHAFDLLLDGGSKGGNGIPTAEGLYDRRTMTRYLRSFLTVLLSVATCKALEGGESVGVVNENDAITTMKGGRRCDSVSGAIISGSDWAASQVFDAITGNKAGVSAVPLTPAQALVGFDDFADWYTKGGYTSIPWLELLDLRKWVLTAPPQQQQQSGQHPTAPPAPR